MTDEMKEKMKELLRTDRAAFLEALRQEESKVYGENVPEDPEARVYFYGAMLGNADDQVQLGARYYLGKGVKQSTNEAYKWFKKAAEQGNVDGQYMASSIDYMAYDYSGVPPVSPIPDKILLWMENAANAGYVDSIVALANIRRFGRFRAKMDKDKAYALYQKAAAQGNEEAKKAIEGMDAFRCQYCGKPDALSLKKGNILGKYKSVCMYCNKTSKR